MDIPLQLVVMAFVIFRETVFASDVIDDKQKKILMNKDGSDKKMGSLLLG